MRSIGRSRDSLLRLFRSDLCCGLAGFEFGVSSAELASSKLEQLSDVRWCDEDEERNDELVVVVVTLPAVDVRVCDVADKMA